MAATPGRSGYSKLSDCAMIRWPAALTRNARNFCAEAWLKAIKFNAGSHVYQDNETLTSEVNSGQVEIGLINHYYWYRLRMGLAHQSYLLWLIFLG